jgi:hypothetical protein
MDEPTLHLSPDELDLWLDGLLPDSRTSHLETCDQCRTAAEESRDVVLALSALPRTAPPEGFAERVLARLPGRIAVDEHFTPDDLDQWVEGALPARREAHLRGCPECRLLADQERMLVMRLEALPLFDPRPGLADRVLDRVQLPVTSLAGAWRVWHRRFMGNPMGVGIAAGVSIMLGGSLAASAAWAAGHQDLITGVGSWLFHQGQQLFWQTVAQGSAQLQQEPWYPTIRAAMTPGRMLAVAAGVSALYAGGVILLRRLLALPEAPQVARALP